MKAYFSHDEGARNDPKLVKVLMRLGQAGKGVYWDLVEMLYEQGGYLPLAEVESYAFALRTDTELITKLLNDFGLFSCDAERFWSETALDRLQMRNEKTERRAAAGAKGGKARAEREAIAKAALEQPLSDTQALLEDSEAMLEQSLSNKRKVNEIKEKESKDSSFQSEDAASAAALVEDVESEFTPTSESPTIAPQTEGGAADVATSVEVMPLKPTRGGRFVKPDKLQLVAYLLSLDAPPPDAVGLAIRFLNHYDSNGWKVGKNPMKDWQATARNWASPAKSTTSANPQQHAVNRPSYSNAGNAAAARLQTPTPDATSSNAWGLPAYTPPSAAALPGGN